MFRSEALFVDIFGNVRLRIEEHLLGDDDSLGRGIFPYQNRVRRFQTFGLVNLVDDPNMIAVSEFNKTGTFLGTSALAQSPIA